MTTEDTQIVSAYSMFETVAEAEASGIWANVGTMEFKLARTGGANEAFMKTAAKRLKPFQNALDQMPRKQQDIMAIGIFVDTILRDWRNVFDRDGTELPFSPENAKRLLTDLPNLFAALQAEANNMSNFTKANLEAAAKN